MLNKKKIIKNNVNNCTNTLTFIKLHFTTVKKGFIVKSIINHFLVKKIVLLMKINFI